MAKKDATKNGAKPVVVGARWKDDPDPHDFPAAADYLSLVFAKADVDFAVEALKKAPLEHRKAKDLLRASRLPLLAKDNAHVGEDLDKVKHNIELSPVLLVRGNDRHAVPMTIADGYHRVCASYLLNENTDIPCRLVDLPNE